MEQLLYEINNKKYLLVEMLITASTDQKKINDAIDKHECIYQGVKDVKSGGLWAKTYVIAKILVPEGSVIQFNKDV